MGPGPVQQTMPSLCSDSVNNHSLCDPPELASKPVSASLRLSFPLFIRLPFPRTPVRQFYQICTLPWLCRLLLQIICNISFLGSLGCRLQICRSWQFIWCSCDQNTIYRRPAFTSKHCARACFTPPPPIHTHWAVRGAGGGG